MPWPGADPRPVWKVWDDFGIDQARLWGWWETNCPVRTGRDDILATAYLRPGKALVALASWAPEKADVHLQVDWARLGLNPARARFRAPAIAGFQPATEWGPEEAVPVAPKRGWLLLVSE